MVMAGWCCLRFLGALAALETAGFRDSLSSRPSPAIRSYRLPQPSQAWSWCLNGSDNPPPPDVGKIIWTLRSSFCARNPVVSFATVAKPTTVLPGQK